MTSFNDVMVSSNATRRHLVAQVDEDLQCVTESEATYARVEDSMNKLLDELRKVEA
jgi:hypothetical protein